MGLISGIAMYIIIWWIILLMVLPVGSQAAKQEEQLPGQASSAPANPRIKYKFLLSLGIAAVVWLIAHWIIVAEVISFRSS